jgi:hypothetical protein
MAIRRSFDYVRMSRAVVVATWCAAATAHAQERIWYADGQEQGDNFGDRFDVAADFDGDGLDELLIGAQGTICLDPGDGTASLFSTSGGELKRWCGSAKWEYLGASVSVMADLDGDGKQDFVLGCPGWDNLNTTDNAGRFLVVSSATGASLLEVDGTEVDGSLGGYVQATPDLNDDGVPDILGAERSYAYASPYHAGRVRLYSGKDGSILREYIGEHEYDYLGSTLALLGDVDADGTVDYAIAASYSGTTNVRGKVYVYSGATGTLLQSWIGQYDNDQLGISIADAGDFDGDGHADVLCGGLKGGTRKAWGHVVAFSGKTGNQLFEIKDSTYKDQLFGQSCAMVGDMDGDGLEEFVVGAPYDGHAGDHCGRVDLFSGRTRRLLYHYYPDPGDTYAIFGWFLKGRADWTHDKIPDFAVTSLRDSTRGRVSIYAGNDLFFQADVTDPAPNTDVTLNLRGGPAGSLVTTVVVGVDGSPTWDTITLTTLDANGEFADVENVPPEASGHDFTLIGYAINAKGKLIDSGTEVVSVQ